MAKYLSVFLESKKWHMERDEPCVLLPHGRKAISTTRKGEFQGNGLRIILKGDDLTKLEHLTTTMAALKTSS